MKRLFSIVTAVAIMATNANAYDYSVLNLMDRLNGLQALLESKTTTGEISFEDFSNELKEMLGGNVRDITADAENTLLVTFNDGTTKTINISELVQGSTLKSGEIIGDKLIFKFNDGRLLKVSLTPLITSFDNKLTALQSSLESQLSNKKVENIYVDDIAKNIVVKYTDGSTSRLNINNLIPTDKHAESGEVGIHNKVLKINLTDGSNVSINLAPLFEQRDALLDGKVDKEPNKTLTTNDFSNQMKEMVETTKVKKLYLDNAAQSFIVTFTNGSTETIDLSRLVEIDENHVESGRLSLGGKSIVLTRKDGSEVSVDIERIYDAIDTKVTIEPGKGLSANDFTNEMKDMVTSIKVVNITYDSTGSKLITTFSDGTVKTDVITGTAVSNHVTSGTFDAPLKSLYLTLLSGQVVTVDMSEIMTSSKVASNIALNANNQLEIKYTDGTTSSVQLKDVFVDSATYSNSTKKITVSKNDGTSFDIDLSDLIGSLDVLLGGKVDKVAGKDLSTNDLTNELKAQIEAVKVVDIVGSDIDKKLTISRTDGSMTDINISSWFNDIKVVAGGTDFASKKIKLDFNDGGLVEVDIAPLVDAIESRNVSDVQYDSSTKEVVITYKDGTTNTIPTFDNHVVLGEYNHSDRKISLKRADDTTLTIDLSTLPISENSLTNELKAKIEAVKVNDVTGSSTDKILTVSKTDGTSSEINISSWFNDIKVVAGELGYLSKGIKLTLSDGDVVRIGIAPLVDAIENRNVIDVQYDNSTKEVVVTYKDGTTETIPTFDNHVTAGAYNHSNKKITLQKSDATNVEIDLSSLPISSNNLTNELKAKIEAVKVDGVTGIEADKKLVISKTDGTSSTISISSWFKNINVVNGSTDFASKKITLSLSDGGTAEVEIAPLVDAINGKNVNNVQFDNSTKNIVVTYKDGTSSVISTFDNHVTAGEYDHSSRKISLKRADNTTVKVDLSDLPVSTNDFTNALKAKVELKKVQNVTRTGDIVTIHYTDGTSTNL